MLLVSKGANLPVKVRANNTYCYAERDGAEARGLNAALSSIHLQLPGVTVKSESAATLSTRGVVFTNQLSTMRLSDIRDTTVDDATLAVPAGFRRNDH
jgi:hypothetical protein